MKQDERDDNRRRAVLLREWRSARNSLMAAWNHSTAGKVVLVVGALLSLLGLVQVGKHVAAFARPRSAAMGELQSRWVDIPRAREGVLATQTKIWGALGVDAQNREGREYGSSISSQQIMYLLDSMKAGTICEIGFYFGLGAANFLHSNEDVVYHGFDLEFNQKLQSIFRGEFGSRAELHPGDSLQTVPALNAKCDIIHVDGNHHGKYPYADLSNMRAKASCDHLIFADDTFECKDYPEGGQCWTVCDNCDCYVKGVCNEASQAWWKAEAEGLIESFGCIYLGTTKGSIGVYPKGYCVGRYKNPPSCSATKA